MKKQEYPPYTHAVLSFLRSAYTSTLLHAGAQFSQTAFRSCMLAPALSQSFFRPHSLHVDEFSLPIGGAHQEDKLAYQEDKLAQQVRT